MESITIHNVTIPTTETTKFGFEFFSFRSPEMVREMECFIKYANGKKCLMDIGAGHGIFSLVFTELNPSGLSYCFEPDSNSFDVLKEVTGSNSRITSQKIALSDVMGTITMKKSAGGYSAVATFDWVKDEEFLSMVGDAIETDFPIDIIKIDVEGAELKVLKGLKNKIPQTFPIIFIELHAYFLTEEMYLELKEILDIWNYRMINTQNEFPISWEEIISTKEGELRLILIHEPNRELFNRYMELK